MRCGILSGRPAHSVANDECERERESHLSNF